MRGEGLKILCAKASKFRTLEVRLGARASKKL